MPPRSFLNRFIIILIIGTFSASCKTGNADKEIRALPTVLVQMAPGAQVSELEEKFSAYSLQLEKKVSRPMDIYLFNFNPEKITEKQLLLLLKKSTMVKEAQRNKEVQNRNTL
jgi:hypothetical protein